MPGKTPTTVPVEPGYITLAEAAERTGLALRTLWNKSSRGALPGAKKFGRVVAIPEASLAALTDNTPALVRGRVTLRELADRTGMKPARVRQMQAQGLVPKAEKTGDIWTLSPEDADAWVKANRPGLGELRMPGDVTLLELAQRIGISAVAIRARLKSEEGIPGARKIGRGYVLSPNAADAYLAAEPRRKLEAARRRGAATSATRQQSRLKAAGVEADAVVVKTDRWDDR
jgi:predicted DNA-binding transcriptional regulator AlpA